MAAKHVNLRWTGHGNRFEGGALGGPAIRLDGDSETAPSPMDALLLSVAGCMGIDILMILQKSRVEVTDLELEVEAGRAPEPPRRFTALRMVVRLAGPTEQDDGRIQRAIELSRDRYCSVMHTLNPDIDVQIDVERR